MRRIFKGSLYTLVGFFGLFFFAMILGAGFPDGTFLNNLGTGVMAATMCSTPILLLVAFVTGIGTLFERNTASATSKHKNDFGMDFEPYPARLAGIMNQLSPDDRAYLEEQLANRRLGVSSDGELMSLDELLDDGGDDKHNSLFTG
jgi:hypothetical protein